jgi:cation:H+ antiporter
MMENVWLPWLKLLACAGVIGYAGSRLSRYGDVIAEKTGLGGTWIGLVLLATVTSLPELVTGISAVALAGVPNIAVGNILGACILNLAMIVLLDFLHRQESVFTRASQGHILSAGFGIILLGVVAFNLALSDPLGGLALGHVGVYSPLIALLYLFALRTVFRYEARQRAEYAGEIVERYPELTLRTAALRYAAASAGVVAAAIYLPFVGAELAQVMGWHGSFVGTLFIAVATTLPELSVTISALRLGALDMAIGNLFGSNLFNLAVLAVDDVFFLQGPILAHVSRIHLSSAISAATMAAVAIVGLLYRPGGRVFGTVGWTSIFLLCGYLLNSVVLALHGE